MNVSPKQEDDQVIAVKDDERGYCSPSPSPPSISKVCDIAVIYLQYVQYVQYVQYTTI